MSAAIKLEPTDVPPPSMDGAAMPPSPAPSREVLRSRRKREVRAHTISVKRMTKRELYLGRALYPEDEHADVARPATRAECKDGERPCPFVSCEHHLYLDVSARTGAIKLNFPDLEVEEMAESCALDVSDRGGSTLEEVGAIMNLTRERIRQVEVKAMAKVGAEIELRQLRDLVGDSGATGKRRLPVIHNDDNKEEDGDDATEEGEPHGGADFDVEHFASDELGAE